MLCHLCGQDTPLVKSHIIPRSFYKPLHDSDGSVPLIVSSASDTYPQRTPTGVYERIVCETCEQLLSKWDDYAYSFLTQGFDPSKYIVDRGEKIAYVFEQFDYVKLKLFFLSVLWRASVASHKLFTRVDLGLHEPVLRAMIQRGCAGEPGKYSVNLFKFDQPINEVPIFDPISEKWSGINCYRFYIGGYTALIKVDQRKVIPEFQDMILSPGKPLCVIIRATFKASKEFALMKKAVRRMSGPVRRALGKQVPKRASSSRTEA